LLDLTIGDLQKRGRLRELLRVREALADHFASDNSFQSSDESCVVSSGVRKKQTAHCAGPPAAGGGKPRVRLPVFIRVLIKYLTVIMKLHT
jgi:hypothetical protein